MPRMGTSTLLSTWSLLFALSACGGRIDDSEQVNQAAGGSFGSVSSTVTTDTQPGAGGSSNTFVSVQSTDVQNVGGDTSVALTALTGGTFGAGGVPINIGGATLIAVGGSLCALSYNGTTYTTLVSQALCGNGATEYSNGEQCDDGNQLSGDGCSNTCRVESNYPCGDGCRPCTTLVVCGDGKVGSDEACDDGNAYDGDGCNATCDTIEPNWICPMPGRHCVPSPSCGDGIVQPDAGETCDEGTINNDGAYGHCAPDCTMPPICKEEILYLDGGVVVRNGCQ